jgi:hypothetical protein
MKKRVKSSIITLMAVAICISIIGAVSGCKKGKEVTPEKNNTPVQISADPSSYKVGDEIEFGKFEQDNEPDTGTEPIVWVVAEKDGTKLTLISKYCLTSMSYNTVQAEVTWADCSLRKWLNEDFINASFSEPEKKILMNVKHGEIFDSAYILDEETFELYMKATSAGETSLTDFAKGQGDTHYTWLRSAEKSQAAPRATFKGDIVEDADPIVNQLRAVRPVVEIDLSEI